MKKLNVHFIIYAAVLHRTLRILRNISSRFFFSDVKNIDNQLYNIISTTISWPNHNLAFFSSSSLPSANDAAKAEFCDSHSFAYSDPGLANSCACVPDSATVPWSNTKILSQFTTVDSLCAIRMEVRPLKIEKQN